MENAQKVDTIVFDKTGTLTYGKLKISEIVNYSQMHEKEILQIAGSIESKSTHPIGKAFLDYSVELTSQLEHELTSLLLSVVAFFVSILLR